MHAVWCALGVRRFRGRGGGYQARAQTGGHKGVRGEGDSGEEEEDTQLEL